MLYRNVLEYLENSAQKYPDKIAYTYLEESFTFSQLLTTAKKIGTKISALTQNTNRPIAVITDRSIKNLSAFFGALYSGNFYVPIDSEMPETRICSILEELKPEFVLYCDKDVKALPKFEGAKTLSYDELFDIDEEKLSDIRSRILDVDPVYVIYTSGSTGVPKGIVISHKAVIDFIEWMSETIGYTHEDVFANQAPFYFDCSVKDIYLTLKLGATDHIIPKKLFMFPTLLIDFLNDNKVTSLTWATSGFNLISTSKILEKKVPEFLNKVAIGGEAMLAKHLNNWKKALPNVKYVNLYGPTEVTVDCTYFVVEEDFLDFEAVPIGKACANMEVLLLDENLSPVKKGEAGEICVRGTGLASGYYNSPEKTSKAFVKNPERPYNDYIYKTGDIGILREDGNIVFQARGDSQIKHLGYRIELGEIERALASIDKIKEAICFYDTENSRIVCVYEGECDKSEIVSSLSQIIPKYMLPNVYRKVPVMPHNQNSKIDRVKLKKEYDDEKNN